MRRGSGCLMGMMWSGGVDVVASVAGSEVLDG